MTPAATPAAATAARALPLATDDADLIGRIADLTAAGQAAWVFDPTEPGVVGLVAPDGRGLAILWDADGDAPDLEIGLALFDASASPADPAPREDTPMRVHELLSLLEDLDPGDEVRIAYQPSWPLAAHVAGIATAEDEPELPCARCGGLTEVRAGEARHLRPGADKDHEPVLDGDGEPGEPGEPGELEPGVVWIVAGDPPDHPYAPRAAFAAVERW